MTGYTWAVPSGGTITAGTGTNAITVTWNTAGARTVTVNYINANGCTATTATVYNVTVNALPVPVITGPATACAGVTGNTYATASGMTGYNWTASAGGTIASGAGTNSIQVTWTTAGAKTVTVNYLNAQGCAAPTASSFATTVNPAPAPTITGLNLVCAGTSNVLYTTQPGFSNYSWSVSYGGIITAGQNSNQVSVNWGTTAGPKFIAVNYDNSFGCSAVQPFMYTVTVLEAPTPLIAGEDTTCQGSTGVAYSTEPNNTAYVWTISSGGTITSGAGSATIHVSWNTAGNQNVSVNYTNAAGCNAVAPTSFTVYVAPKPAAAGAITGTTPVCAGTHNVVYSVPVIANALTYSWTVPAGATIVSGANTNSITVNFALTAASGIFKVNGVNNCGSGSSSPNFSVTVNPLPSTPVITQHGDTLTSSANSGNQWYLNGNVIPGATGKNYVAVYIGNYTVVVTLSGCSSAVSNSILVLPVSVNNREAGQTFEIYPNPNNGQFNIKLENLKPDEYSIEIYNGIGSLVWKQENVRMDGSYSTPVNLKDFPAGIYSVALRNKANSLIRKVIILN